MNILTVNAGSSSIKYKFYQNLKLVFSGLIEGINEACGQWSHADIKKSISFKDHQQAFIFLQAKLEEILGEQRIDGIGHRVVHGGTYFFKPTVVNAEVLINLKKLSALAPLHNPVNILGIEFAKKAYPQALQVAVFDTGFHHSMPEYVRCYPILQKISDDYKIKRYGFHGINHEFVARAASDYLQKPLSNCNFISLHLGNGASCCLIKNGQSFDTSMGMTPLAGLMMGTRCGDIDPGIILHLLAKGVSPEAIEKLLNKESGLKGITGINDMRAILARCEQQDSQALLAIEMYTYILQKFIGAYLSQCPKLDALIFTGGVGENASYIRQKALVDLEHLGLIIDETLNNEHSSISCRAINAASSLPILVIKGDEESLIAAKVCEFLSS